MQDFASLKRFGLLIESSPGKWRVAPAAMDILLLPDTDAKHQQRVRDLALAPKVHADLWKEFKANLPSDATLIHKLVVEKGFQENSAKDFIKQYKKTLAFAKPENDDKITDEVNDSGAGDTLEVKDGEVGKADLPRQDLFRVMPTPKFIPLQAGEMNMQPTTKQDVFNLDEGLVVLQWPSRLSQESYDDLKDWMELQLRKIARSIGKGPSGNGRTPDDPHGPARIEMNPK